jgi:hypothetical protein
MGVGMGRMIVALFAGTLFGLGLAVSGMMNPAKVMGFLDVAGDWDPTLMFALQEPRDREGVLLVLAHPDGQSLEAAQHYPGVKRPRNPPAAFW